ncbi:MAG: hypothetical protein KF764_22000 [Labilithrix sp.]|nr:hypothetical protein [Labilithrix sp.]MBX3223339.1 hypothetical protein [Labilithrix sp.]
MFADDADAESDANEHETVFESFFDRDSGVWSLRRVPTAPPPPELDELAPHG